VYESSSIIVIIFLPKKKRRKSFDRLACACPPGLCVRLMSVRSALLSSIMLWTTFRPFLKRESKMIFTFDASFILRDATVQLSFIVAPSTSSTRSEGGTSNCTY
jgi:hypothetical protein